MSASMQIIRFFSLRAAFSPSDKLGLHLLKKLHYYCSIKILYETTSEDNNNKTKQTIKRAQVLMGQNVLLIVNTRLSLAQILISL